MFSAAGGSNYWSASNPKDFFRQITGKYSWADTYQWTKILLIFACYLLIAIETNFGAKNVLSDIFDVDTYSRGWFQYYFACFQGPIVGPIWFWAQRFGPIVWRSCWRRWDGVWSIPISRSSKHRRHLRTRRSCRPSAVCTPQFYALFLHRDH